MPSFFLILSVAYFVFFCYQKENTIKALKQMKKITKKSLCHFSDFPLPSIIPFLSILTYPVCSSWIPPNFLCYFRSSSFLFLPIIQFINISQIVLDYLSPIHDIYSLAIQLDFYLICRSQNYVLYAGQILRER